MITQLGYIITCDSDQCADTLDGGPAQIAVDTITSGDALRVARREGWRRLSRHGHYFDVCPACLEANDRDDEDHCPYGSTEGHEAWMDALDLAQDAVRDAIGGAA